MDHSRQTRQERLILGECHKPGKKGHLTSIRLEAILEERRYKIQKTWFMHHPLKIDHMESIPLLMKINETKTTILFLPTQSGPRRARPKRTDKL